MFEIKALKSIAQGNQAVVLIRNICRGASQQPFFQELEAGICHLLVRVAQSVLDQGYDLLDLDLFRVLKREGCPLILEGNVSLLPNLVAEI